MLSSTLGLKVAEMNFWVFAIPMIIWYFLCGKIFPIPQEKIVKRILLSRWVQMKVDKSESIPKIVLGFILMWVMFIIGVASISLIGGVIRSVLTYLLSLGDGLVLS